jgi:hypothetical protein
MRNPHLLSAYLGVPRLSWLSGLFWPSRLHLLDTTNHLACVCTTTPNGDRIPCPVSRRCATGLNKTPCRHLSPLIHLAPCSMPALPNPAAAPCLSPAAAGVNEQNMVTAQ